MITSGDVSKYADPCQRFAVNTGCSFGVQFFSMRTAIFYILVTAQLFWWDLVDKVLLIVGYSLAQGHINATVSFRARRLLAIASTWVGFNFRFDPLPPGLPREMLIVANHQSLIDIAAIMAYFGDHSVRFVAKRELRKWFPAVSGVLRIQKHALINRHRDFSAAMREIDRMSRRLGPGECPVIFPEGTRSRDGQLLPFHSGAIRRVHAIRPLPIVALAIEGGSRYATLRDFTAATGGDVYHLSVVRVFPPVQGKRELLEQISIARDSISQRIAQWRNAG